MSAGVFDTLILSRKLAAAGMATDQAQGVAAALAETLGEQIATRRDLETVRRDLQRDIQDVEQRLNTRITALDVSMRTEFAALRGELWASEQRQTIRLGMMLAVAVGVMGTLVKVL